MKTQFKAVILIFLFPALLFANSNKPEAKQTKEKTYHKEYSVNSDAKLKVNNSFGNIDIVTWNENRIVIIQIKKAKKGRLQNPSRVYKRLRASPPLTEPEIYLKKLLRIGCD